MLEPPVQREVWVDGEDEPHTVLCYTIRESSRALGRDSLTVKRWIEEGMLPESILVDTSRGYKQYSVGELEVIARILVEHSRSFRYYARSHIETRERLLEAVEAYRDEFI